MTAPYHTEIRYSHTIDLENETKKWLCLSFFKDDVLIPNDLVLYKNEDSLTCEGFIEERNGICVLTKDHRYAQTYGAFKILVSDKKTNYDYEKLSSLFPFFIKKDISFGGSDSNIYIYNR